MSYCDDKKLASVLVEESRKEIETNLEKGISNIIEYPHSNVKNLRKKYKEATKARERKTLLKHIDIEKKRFKAHQNLFNHIMRKSIDDLHNVSAFVIPDEYVSNRLDFIQGVFQEAYSKSAFAKRDEGLSKSGLNNSSQWDAPKINYILYKIKQWEKRANSDKELSSYEKTIKMPLLVASAIDPSGQVRKFVKMTTTLLDSYLQIGYPWKTSIIDPITKQKNPISLQSIEDKLKGIGARGEVSDMSNYQKTVAATQLSEELLHDEVRSIIPRDIPTNPKEFTKWRNSWEGKQFFQMIKFESERHEIGDSDSRYVMIPLHSSDKGINILSKYRKYQKSSGQKAVIPNENENAFIVYRIPDNLKSFFSSIKNNKSITKESLEEQIKPSELEEGFFTAQEHRVYKYESIPGTDTPKRKYADWKKGVKFQNKIYDPPDSWMPEMWDSIEMQREWNELFYEKVLKKEHSKVMQELDDYMAKIQPILMENGWHVDDIQEMFDKISSIGGIKFNLTQDKQGNFISSNSFVRKASKFGYGHIKFENAVYLDMVQEAVKAISSSYLPEIDAQIATDENILNSEESDLVEKAESRERLSDFYKRKKYYEDMLNNLEKRLYGDTDTEADKKEIMMVHKILATKGRTLFTDHKKRRKDRSLWSEYVDEAIRANELTRMKIELFKTILAFKDNPSLVNYIVDQTKVAAGDADIEAGFFNLNYSDSNISKIFKNWFGKDVSPERIRDTGVFIRSLKTAFNLGMGTAFTNNFQRANGIINYGFDYVMDSMRAMNPSSENNGTQNHKYQELIEQVEETGVLHPGNAFIDMLTLGMDLGQGNSSDAKEAILPLVDLIRLQKATSLEGWIDQSKSWDKLITSAQNRGAVGEKIQLEEIQRVKKEIYEIYHGDYKPKHKKYLQNRLKDLRLGLSQSAINRLVKWKLEWFPTAGEYTTMSGSERRMRSEFAFIGFKLSEEMGRVNIPESGDWKYTDSQDAIDMARLSVYMNLFGFTKVMASKMFRGAVGGMGWQFRQYDYHQTVVEMEWLRSAAMSPEGMLSNKALGYGALAFKIPWQIAKKSMRGGMHAARLAGMTKEQVLYWQKHSFLNKDYDDKNLDRATNFFLIRGLPTIMLKFLYFNFAPYTIFRSVQGLARSFTKDDINMRASRGLESMVVSKIITASMLLSYAFDIGMMSADDEDDTIEDAIRQLPFSMEIITMLLWVVDFGENFWRGARPYLPTPFKQLGDESVREFADDIIN
jgi:hypothetical protein